MFKIDIMLKLLFISAIFSLTFAIVILVSQIRPEKNTILIKKILVYILFTVLPLIVTLINAIFIIYYFSFN
jgi:hypothetical protein